MNSIQSRKLILEETHSCKANGFMLELTNLNVIGYNLYYKL